MTPKEMTPEEAYQEALRRIAVAREQRLTEVDLTNLLWDCIPAEVFELEWLTVLRICWWGFGGGEIQHLPAEFASFKCLQLLDITNRKISDLEPLAGLTQLQALNCGGNQLTDLAPLAGLTQLQTLDCGDNQLTDLAPLAGLTQLQALKCWHNQLTDLAPLAGLTQLQTLDCGYNQLTDLTPLANLTQLHQLSCWGNRLTDLGPLAGLTQLHALNCSHNRITDLNPIKPAVLAGRLPELYVFANPIRSLPSELLGSYPRSNVAEKLRDYWQELEQGAEPNRDIKVILIGNGCVGKTTLAHALGHRCRPPEQIIERTHGIVIETLEWQIPEDEQPIKVQLWDFGGQEIYHATHRLFLHRNAGYLLLWAEETDEAPSETRHPVGYWSSLIHDHRRRQPGDTGEKPDRSQRPAAPSCRFGYIGHLRTGIENQRLTLSRHRYPAGGHWRTITGV